MIMLFNLTLTLKIYHTSCVILFVPHQYIVCAKRVVVVAVVVVVAGA